MVAGAEFGPQGECRVRPRTFRPEAEACTAWASIELGLATSLPAMVHRQAHSAMMADGPTARRGGTAHDTHHGHGETTP